MTNSFAYKNCKLKKYIYRMTAILVCLLCVCKNTTAVTYAATSETASVRTEQFFTTNDNAVKDTFDYIFEALDMNAPMPAGSTGNIYKFTMTGSGDDHVFDITYSVQGIYHYKLYQDIPNPGEKNYSYDDSVYEVTAYYTEDTSAAKKLTMIIEKVGSGKAIDPPFTNIYKDPGIPDPTDPTEPTSPTSPTDSSGGQGGDSGNSQGGSGTSGPGINNGSADSDSEQPADGEEPEELKHFGSFTDTSTPLDIIHFFGLGKTGENNTATVVFLILLVSLAIFPILLWRRRRDNKAED